MKVNIYQVNLDRDEKGLAFESFKDMQKTLNAEAVDASVYDRVFSGEVEAGDLEDVYRIFNIEKPEKFRGRSMSVSDVVEVTESDSVRQGCYYCDAIGFKKAEFDAELCGNLNELITVVMCEPGKKAYVTEVGRELEDLQKTVKGNIEVYYPFDSEEAIICNEEGKLNGMSPGRAIYGEDGEMKDIVFGPFIICDCSGEDFGSLSEENRKKYLELFDKPEHFYRINGEIKAIKYEPRERQVER